MNTRTICELCGKRRGIRRGTVCRRCQSSSGIEYLSCDLGRDSIFDTFKDACSDVSEKLTVLAYQVGSFLRDPSGFEKNLSQPARRTVTLVEAFTVILMTVSFAVLFFAIVYLATAIETDEEKEIRRMERSYNVEASEH